MKRKKKRNKKRKKKNQLLRSPAKKGLKVKKKLSRRIVSFFEEKISSNRDERGL
jgi:hypothetical protein